MFHFDAHTPAFFLLVSLMALADSCQQSSPAPVFFSDTIRDELHRPAVNERFRQADSLKYARDFSGAQQAFETLAHQALAAEEHSYALNQLAYLSLMLRQDSTVQRQIEQMEKEAPLQGIALADFLYNKGLLDYHRLQGEAAMRHFRRALPIYQQVYGENHLRTLLCRTQIGLLDYEFAPVIDSMRATVQYIEPLLQSHPEIAERCPEAYLLFAFSVRTGRDYLRGGAYCDAAIQSAQSAPWVDTVFVARCMGTKGHLLKKQGRYEDAERLLRTAIAWSKNKNRWVTQECYRDLLLLSMRDEVKFAATLEEAKQFLGNGPDAYIHLERLLGYHFDDLGQHRRCIFHYRRFLQQLTKAQPDHRYLADEAHATLSEQYRSLGLYDSALYFQRRLFLAGTLLEDQNLSVEQLMNPEVYRLKTHQFWCFGKLAAIFFERYKSTRHPADLDLSTRLFVLTDSLMFPGLIHAGEESILSFQSEVGDAVYPMAIEAAFESYQRSKHTRKDALDRAFRYFERQKSYLLYRGMRPDTCSVERPDERLLADIQATDEQVRTATSQTLLTGHTPTHFNRQNQRLDSLYQVLRARYPRYHELRVAQRAPGVAVVQGQMANPDQAMIQYNIGPTWIHILCISRDTVLFLETARPDSFERQILRFRQLVSDAHSSIRDYATVATGLYCTLLGPVFGAAPRQYTDLVIVADKSLHLLPFEALLEGNAEEISDFDKAPYLQRDKQISYASSWKIWSENRSTRLPVRPRVAMFSYGNRESPCKLTGWETEKKALSQVFPRHQVFEGAACNSRRFIQEGRQCDILHLSLHGQSSLEKREDNKLYFSILPSGAAGDCVSDAFYAFQLGYGDLKADLAVLSACETAVGTTSTGEGAFSLSRAFIRAGCRHVVASLWNVSGQTTAEILTVFYERLAAGMPPVVALNAARRVFLMHADKARRHPAYWAGLTIS